jgi:proliferating cell nuclear antigen PCNA
MGSLTLGIHLPDLITLLKLGQGDDSLVIQYSSGSSVIKVSLQASKTPTVCEFSLNLIQIDFEDTFYVEVDGTGRFTMNSKTLYNTFSDLGLIAEYLAINLNKMRVKFRVCTDVAGGSVNLKHVRGENGVVVSTSRTFNVEINLALAKRIAKAYSLCERVELRVYDREPVIFCYFFDGIELKFYLAPALSETSESQ